MNKRTCIKIFQSPQAHVVQVIGLMVGPGRIGIVMELCDTSLAKRIQERSAALNWAETVRLLMDGTAGLGFIHKQKKTTHGDLKPDNLLIQEGRLKVADFGTTDIKHEESRPRPANA